MHQEVSSSLLPVQKAALFSVILCSPSNVYFLYCLCFHDNCLSIGIGVGHAYASAVWLCSWVAIRIFKRIHPSTFYKSSLFLFVLYHPAQSSLWLLVRSAFPQLWRCFVCGQQLIFQMTVWLQKIMSAFIRLQDTAVHSWSLAKLPEVFAKVIQAM